MPASIEAAKAGATTGEWGDALRAEFGVFRAPTGVSSRASGSKEHDPLRSEVERVSLKLGRRLRFLIGKPGLDGHSNGAEQIAARATDAGMEVVYDGIRLTPAEIVEAAKSGVHWSACRSCRARRSHSRRRCWRFCARPASNTCRSLSGGIVPPADVGRLKAAGVAAVYTPKRFRDQQHPPRGRAARSRRGSTRRAWSVSEDRRSSLSGDPRVLYVYQKTS